MMQVRDFSKQLTLYDDTGAPRGVYSLISDVDKSVKELRDEFYDFKKETERRFSGLEKDVAGLKLDVEDLKLITRMTQAELREFKTATKEELKELRNDVNEIKSGLRAFTIGQNRFNLILAIVGIVIALIEFLKH